MIFNIDESDLEFERPKNLDVKDIQFFRVKAFFLINCDFKNGLLNMNLRIITKIMKLI